MLIKKADEPKLLLVHSISRPLVDMEAPFIVMATDKPVMTRKTSNRLNCE